MHIYSLLLPEGGFEVGFFQFKFNVRLLKWKIHTFKVDLHI